MAEFAWLTLHSFHPAPQRVVIFDKGAVLDDREFFIRERTTERLAKTLFLRKTSALGFKMQPCIQREGLSKGSSSSDNNLEPGGQCSEELWMQILQPTTSHDEQASTQPDNSNTLRHVHTTALEDISSNFDTAFTSTSLPETKEACPATLAHRFTSFESEDFEMWLKAFGASPNIEYGLEPESSEIPLFPAGEIHQTFSGNSIGNGYYYTDAAIHNSLSSSYLCLANNIPYVMNVISPSTPEPISTFRDFDGFEKSNDFEMRYQLVRKLAPAAEAQFMTHQERTTNNEHWLVPATKPRKTRQCFDPLKREKVKQVRRLGACLRCRMYREPVSSMLDVLSIVD